MEETLTPEFLIHSLRAEISFLIYNILKNFSKLKNFWAQLLLQM